MKRSIRMNAADMVATAMEELFQGDQVGVYTLEGELSFELVAQENIPFGNKLALCDAKAGETVLKYGAPIGELFQTVRKGELVHVHNIKSNRADLPSSIRQAIIEQMGIAVNNEDRNGGPNDC